MSGLEILVRPATQKDLPFLERMTAIAAFWDPAQDRPSDAVALADPAIGMYVQGFRTRPGDFGLVAESHEREPIGAAWFRFFSEETPAYGFVAADIPEVTLAVEAEWRGNGIGERLMRELAACAHEAGLGGLSLSVSNANGRARRLYDRLGYRVASHQGDSRTMVLDLGRQPGED